MLETTPHGRQFFIRQGNVDRSFLNGQSTLQAGVYAPLSYKNCACTYTCVTKHLYHQDWIPGFDVDVDDLCCWVPTFNPNNRWASCCYIRPLRVPLALEESRASRHNPDTTQPCSGFLLRLPAQASPSGLPLPPPVTLPSVQSKIGPYKPYASRSHVWHLCLSPVSLAPGNPGSRTALLPVLLP